MISNPAPPGEIGGVENTDQGHSPHAILLLLSEAIPINRNIARRFLSKEKVQSDAELWIS